MPVLIKVCLSFNQRVLLQPGEPGEGLLSPVSDGRGRLCLSVPRLFLQTTTATGSALPSDRLRRADVSSSGGSLRVFFRRALCTSSSNVFFINKRHHASVSLVQSPVYFCLFLSVSLKQRHVFYFDFMSVSFSLF